MNAQPERGLDASSAAEPDRHLIAVNDHRNRAAALAEPEHPLQPRLVFLDVDVLERNLPPLKVVTGGLRIRSGVFAEDENHVSILLRGQIWVRSRSDPVGENTADGPVSRFDFIATSSVGASRMPKEFASCR